MKKIPRRGICDLTPARLELLEPDLAVVSEAAVHANDREGSYVA